MKTQRFIFSAALAIAAGCLAVSLVSGCKKPETHTYEGGEGGNKPTTPTTPEQPSGFTLPESNADAIPYADLHDPIADAGQFYHPENKMNPKKYVEVVYTDYGGREEPNSNKNSEGTGLQNYMLIQSIAGLINRACEKGELDFAVWVQQEGTGYVMERQVVDPTYDSKSRTGDPSIYVGRQTAIELLTKDSYPEGHPYWQIRHYTDKYVLTDLVRNPESVNVATVAAHVYNAIVVDVRDKDFFESKGYSMAYDASQKTLQDAFDEFKDKCNNDALVLMPVKTGEWRDYAIAKSLFVVNLNKQYNSPGSGQNVTLFNQVLDWMKPNSQVFGWEQGVGEDVFVNRVSAHGHMVLAADWSYNHMFTSHNYRQRQPATLVKTINPRSIDYGKKKHFYTPFLTDGDNYQFIITDNFEDNYYVLSTSTSTKTAYEIGTEALIQLAPTRFKYLVEKQPSAQTTIMETFGGGYYYVDTYSTEGASGSHRKENLKIVAERTAAHMRQHGIKVLHIMAQNLASSKTTEALQAFVDANDQLEGITAVQYSPYTGGEGDIYWFKNKAGYDIPCITTRYMVWDGQYSPSTVAALMKSKETASPSFCTLCLHAWSEPEGKKASDVAALVKNKLSSDFEAVSMQELIWRVRMQYREEQTMKFLATIK